MKRDIEGIFKSIEYYDESFPEDKIKELINRHDESRKFLVKYIKDFKKHIFEHLNEDDYVGHIYAVIILAQFKEKSLCQIFLELLDLPGTRVFELFDVIIPEYAGRIIASVYDNNTDNILKVLNNKKANQYAKSVVIQALKVLCINKELTKEQLEDFLISLLNEKLKDKNHAVLLEILYTAFELNMQRVLDLLKNNCQKGEYKLLSFSEVEAEIKLYEEGLYSNKGIDDVHNQEINDAFEELKVIFRLISDRNNMRKEAKEFQDYIIEEINFLGKKFQKGIKSNNLESHLSRLDKDELYNIGKHLGLKGYYKLRKKELIDSIFNNYEELIKNKLMYFDEERIQVLRTFLKNGGIKKVDRSIQFNDFFYFESYGLIFPFAEENVTAFIMPNQVREIIKNVMSGFTFRKCVKKNSEIISLVKGMMEAYGIMKKDDLIKRLYLYDVNESEAYIKRVIDEGFGIYYILLDRNKLVNEKIDNFTVVDELEKNMINDDYKFFTKEELVAMSKYDWTESVTYVEEFYQQFEEEFMVERENLIEIINDMKADIQVVDAEVIIQFMVNSIDSTCRDKEEVDELKESKKIVRNLVSKFLKNVPLWKYKGRCIEEVNGK